MALVQLEPGTVFAGEFRVIALLSQGGMGAIYVVEQMSTGARRALKITLPQIVSDARHRRRFEQEARIGALIESDHVVQVVGAGVDAATRTPWLAMELLRGQDLAAHLEERVRLPLHEVSAILEQLCHALGAAHRAGIVHRDLKPENVFLSSARRANARSEVKVLDFGIAKVVAEAFTSGSCTIGSPIWMAPEQTGQGLRIGPEADVWALGLLAFRSLTGLYFWRTPNEDGPLAALLREVVLNEIPPATRRAREYGVERLLPPRFDEWFARCVHRDPRARFEDARVAYAVFWAMLREPDASAPDLDEDTAVDLSDQSTTLSSIPPAKPRSLDDAGEVTDHGEEQPEPSEPITLERGTAPRRVARPVLPGAPSTVKTGASRAKRRAGAAVAGVLAVTLAAAFAMRAARPPPTPPLALAPGPRVAATKEMPARVRRRVSIPAGTFLIGSPDGGAGEPATRKVMISAFEIDQAEVTSRAWLECEAEGACTSIYIAALDTSPQCNRPRPDRLDHPINCVTWADAVQFCKWAGGRLPTGDEWEYAAAAGSEGVVNAFPWGPAPRPLFANGAGDDDGYAFTAPVSVLSRDRSAFGVLGMAGNVEEWTADAWSTDRVTRGGSYESEAGALRTSRRGRARPTLRAPTLGFRCARTPE